MANRYLEKIAGLASVYKKNRYLLNLSSYKKDVNRIDSALGKETFKHLGRTYRNSSAKPIESILNRSEQQHFMNRTAKFDRLGMNAWRSNEKAKKIHKNVAVGLGSGAIIGGSIVAKIKAKNGQ